MFPEKNSYKTFRTFILSHWCWPVAYALDSGQVLVDTVFTQGQQNPLHDCTAALLEAHHNSCVQPIVSCACTSVTLLFNSVVGSGVKAKRGVVLAKSALWPHGA